MCTGEIVMEKKNKEMEEEYDNALYYAQIGSIKAEVYRRSCNIVGRGIYDALKFVVKYIARRFRDAYRARRL